MTTTEVEQLHAEIDQLRADWERFRGKMAREFVALVDEYRNIDEIRSRSGNQ